MNNKNQNNPIEYSNEFEEDYDNELTPEDALEIDLIINPSRVTPVRYIE